MSTSSVQYNEQQGPSNQQSQNILAAQRLNNQGAQSLREARYDDAMTSFINALKISERALCFSSVEGCCSCRFCTIDHCMSLSFDRQEDASSSSSLSYDRQENQQPYDSTSDSEMDDAHSNDSFCGFICGKPIFVPTVSIEEGHQMGMTLSLIIIFNLALTYHLTALKHMRRLHEEELLPTTQEDEQLKTWLGKGKKLYEVAYRLQSEGVQQREVCSSIRFVMIVSNNLGEVHRLLKDRTRHEKCLEHLLSTMMYYYVVDSYRDLNSNTQQRQRRRRHEEMDGFLRNTSHLILRKQCASAA